MVWTFLQSPGGFCVIIHFLKISLEFSEHLLWQGINFQDAAYTVLTGGSYDFARLLWYSENHRRILKNQFSEWTFSTPCKSFKTMYTICCHAEYSGCLSLICLPENNFTMPWISHVFYNPKWIKDLSLNFMFFYTPYPQLCVCTMIAYKK